jgi:hypothetical protein
MTGRFIFTLSNELVKESFSRIKGFALAKTTDIEIGYRIDMGPDVWNKIKEK